jgi:hypothetical protein
MRKLLLSSVIMLAMSAYVHAASLLASVEGNWAIDNTFNCSVPSKACTLRFFGNGPASEFEFAEWKDMRGCGRQPFGSGAKSRYRPGGGRTGPPQTGLEGLAECSDVAGPSPSLGHVSVCEVVYLILSILTINGMPLSPSMDVSMWQREPIGQVRRISRPILEFLSAKKNVQSEKPTSLAPFNNSPFSFHAFILLSHWSICSKYGLPFPAVSNG